MLVKGPESSVGSVLDSLSYVMQHREFDPPRSLPAVGIYPLKLTWVLTPFPKTLSDESINRGLVCAHIHSIKRTQTVLTFMGECRQQKYTQHAPSMKMECDYFCG